MKLSILVKFIKSCERFAWFFFFWLFYFFVGGAATVAYGGSQSHRSHSHAGSAAATYTTVHCITVSFTH